MLLACSKLRRQPPIETHGSSNYSSIQLPKSGFNKVAGPLFSPGNGTPHSSNLTFTKVPSLHVKNITVSLIAITHSNQHQHQ